MRANFRSKDVFSMTTQALQLLPAYCLQMSSWSDYVNFPTVPPFPLNNAAATIEAWIQTTAQDSQTIVLFCNPPGAAPRVTIGPDSTLGVYWDPSGDAPGYSSADTTPVTDGNWHHVAVVFDQRRITFYKDGIATDSVMMSSPQPATSNLQIGAALGSATAFNGLLYDVRVWATARSAAQIADFRYAVPRGPSPWLVVSTSFANGEVTNAIDGTPGTCNGQAQIIHATLPTPPVISGLFSTASALPWAMATASAVARLAHVRDILTDAPFLTYTLGYSAALGAFFIFFSTSPRILIGRLGMSPTAFSAVFGTAAVAMICTSRFTGKLAARWGERGCLVRGMVLLITGAALLTFYQLYAFPSLWGFVGPVWLIAIGISITCAVTANGALRAFSHAAGTATAVYSCGESIVVAIAGTLAVDSLPADTAWPLVGFCVVFETATLSLASVLLDR